MAEKRMINKSISVSEKVNIQLPNLFDKLLFTWMIPHADDFGRMPGSPAKIKGLVVPMLYDITLKDVESALQEMHNIGLIIWYEIDGDKYIQFRSFEEHQSGLHKRTKSKFPEFPGNSQNSTEIPSELKGREGNRTEENGTELKRTEEEQKTALLGVVNRLGLQCRGGYELEEVYSYIGMMEYEVIEDSLNRSEQAKKVSYAIGILKDRNKKQLYTVEDCVKAGEMHEKHGGTAQGLRLIRNPKASQGLTMSDSELDEYIIK